MDINQLIEELPGEGSSAASAGPICEKCGAEIPAKDSLVCQKCGWYASIGSFVEIDKSWEVATNPELATEEDALPKEKANLPLWAYILAGCIFAIITESMAARIITTGSTRTFWSVTQLFIGFVAYGVCHTYCFILVLKNEADVKLLDYILRPIKSWSIIFRGMPERSWACYCGMSGLTAVAMSLLVIGSIPYEVLLDWNVKEKAKFNLIGAIADQASKIEAEEKSMEEALGEFTDKAGINGKDNKPNQKPREKQDCIIIGYMANQAGEIQTLFLAAEHFARLKYAGSARVTDLADDQLQQLTKNLVANRTHKPFVRISIDGATWVKPKYLCRVSYRRRGKQGGLYGARIEDLLGEVDLSKKKE